MNLNEKAKCLQNFSSLLEKESTGNAKSFAKRLGISRSCLYGLIDEVENMGVEIKYNRQKESFYYSNNKILAVCIPVKVIDNSMLSSECPYKQLLLHNYRASIKNIRNI